MSGRRRMAGRLGLRVALAILAGVPLQSCKPRELADGLASQPDAPTYADLAAAHNARAALLKTMVAQGVVGIRWKDDDGSHYEQGDVDLWLRMPSEVALQVSKMGERLFWLGSDGEANWILDLRKKGQTVAEITGPAVEPAPDAGMPVQMSMATVLEMMALLPIPESPPADGPDMAFDAKKKAWLLTTAGSAGPMRVRFDAASKLPLGVELLDPATGEAKLASTLDHYEYIFTAGAAVTEFPRVPTQIDIERTDGRGSIKLTLTRPVDRDESFQENYFNINWVLAAMKPDQVRDHRPSTASVRGSAGRAVDGAVDDER